MPSRDFDIILRKLHPMQVKIKRSHAKRKMVRAGRRGGKTILAADIAVEGFLDGRRVLYAAPTTDQIEAFWTEVKRALAEPLDAKVFYKNETKHLIGFPDIKVRIIDDDDPNSPIPGKEARIRAKTAWNADTLRGDWADLLILDEFHLMNESAWEVVGIPMLMDNDGDALLIYTPPSLATRFASKARDKMHAAKLYKAHDGDPTGRWECFTFTSHDNPNISIAALADVTKDMSRLAYRMEIMAEDVDEVPGALWTRKMIEDGRVKKLPGDLERVVVAIDPPGSSTGNEAGILGGGRYRGEYYVLEDDSKQASPEKWASAGVTMHQRLKGDRIAAERNFGGEMVESTIRAVDPNVPVTLVNASRGKQVRAEPVSALYEKGLVHHVGNFPQLEDELCLWVPGDPSPNRLDALVWLITELKETATDWNDTQDLGHIDGYQPLGQM